ncbi:MAG: oligosaccharide flippase family protein [Acidobacteriaceae bacterium]|nr:oligosaccharide flippase family protein [Acidobacteriaceae bacterium]
MRASFISLRRYAGYLGSVAGAKTAGILITSVTFPYLVRRLGVEAYGQWSYVVAICAFLNIIGDPGMNVFLTQRVAAQREAAFQIIPDVLFLRFIASAIALIALLAVASREPVGKVRDLLRFYGIGVSLVNLLVADHLLGALELFHIRSVLNVTQQILYASMIFVFVRSARDVIWVPSSILCSSALCGLTGWAVLWRKGTKFRFHLRPHTWAEILRPSFHYASSTLMSNLYHRTGHVGVRWLLGDFALGFYAAAARLVDIVRGFIVTFCQVLMPRIAVAESTERLRKLAKFAMGILAIVSIPLAIGLIGTAHLIVPLVMGARFLPAAGVLQWMAPYVVTASAASLFCGTILFAMGRHRAYLVSTAAGAGAGIFLYATLIPALGLKGAALALVLAELVVAATALARIPELHGVLKNPMLWVAFGSAMLMLVAIRVTTAYSSQIYLVVAVGASVYIASCGWYVRRFLVHT